MDIRRRTVAAGVGVLLMTTVAVGTVTPRGAEAVGAPGQPGREAVARSYCLLRFVVYTVFGIGGLCPHADPVRPRPTTTTVPPTTAGTTTTTSPTTTTVPVGDLPTKVHGTVHVSICPYHGMPGSCTPPEPGKMLRVEALGPGYEFVGSTSSATDGTFRIDAGAPIAHVRAWYQSYYCISDLRPGDTDDRPVLLSCTFYPPG